MQYYFKASIRFILSYNINVLRASSYRAIGLMSRVLANGPGDRGSISGQVIPKTQKNGS